MIKDQGLIAPLGTPILKAGTALLAVLALAACDDGATGGGGDPAATELPAPSDTTTPSQ